MSSALRPWLLDRYARLLLMVGRRSRALDLYRDITRQDPGYAEAWRTRGFLAAERDLTDEALESLTRALQIEPHDTATRFNYGFLLHQGGRRAQAMAEFEQVIALAPNNDRAWYGLGVCRSEDGDFEGAIPALKEAARLQYFNPHAGYHLAFAYHRIGQRKALVEEYERVNGFDPKMAAKIRADTGL